MRGQFIKEEEDLLLLHQILPLLDLMAMILINFSRDYGLVVRNDATRTYHAWKRSHKFPKFKEGEKSVTFLSYDGAYGQTDKVLNFIQQDHKFQKF